MARKDRFLGALQKMGKALMTPIAVLPAAGLLNRLGAPDVWNIPWMMQAGGVIFESLPLIFAIGVSVGIAEENNGISALAATVGYMILTRVAVSFDTSIIIGVLGGILIGVMAGILYNKYKEIELPQFLGFFGGKRFVPIITSILALALGLLAGYVWPTIQEWLNILGISMGKAGAIGAFGFGVLNRLLIPFGLHHILNAVFWMELGNFETASGIIAKGDIARFFALDPTAGTYMTGFFPIMMFALPAACLAMITTAKRRKRKAVTGMLIGIAFTSFLTGITEPIEFLFMFLAPGLYLIHALLTGVSLALTTALGIRMGFNFSAGAIDYGLSFGISSKPLWILPIGLVFGVLYYVIFVFCIKKFNIPTPGRINEDENRHEEPSFRETVSGLSTKAKDIINAIGGKKNVEAVDACITRVRLSIKDDSKVNDEKLRKLGITAIMRMGEGNLQIVVGTIADPLVTQMKKILKK